MTKATDVRAHLATALFLCLIGFLVVIPRAQAPAEAWFTLTKIGPNVWAAMDTPSFKQRAYANAGFVIGDDGVVVVDTLTGPDASGRLVQEIRALTNLPVRFVVNTHYHGDHVAGNKLFADAGARILAHRNVRTWIHAENIRLLGDKPNPDLITLIKQFAAPTMTYTGAVDLHLGSRAIQVRMFPGHTGGDSVVIVPDAKVVFGGDLIWKNVVPNTVDGSTKAWMQTLIALATDYAGYTFVPGHGGLATAPDVLVFRDYLATLQKLVADARASGKTGAAVAPVVLPRLKEQYGHWEGFEYLAPLNIADADAEQRGKKRVPQP
jgi:glyoxylase-like metal-dependent hydrolase (beta-lactamase superfamily II)